VLLPERGTRGLLTLVSRPEGRDGFSPDSSLLVTARPVPAFNFHPEPFPAFIHGGLTSGSRISYPRSTPVTHFLASNRNAVGPRSGRAVMPDLGKIRARSKIQDEPGVGAGTAVVILRNECGRVVWAK
jgi:hypothetical protein